MVSCGLRAVWGCWRALISQIHGLFTSQPQVQVLPGAHDFVINVGARPETDEKLVVLRALSDRAISGAEYNSAERDPPPSCHPGTRTAIREELGARIINPALGTKIIWIHGPAGVGKSAIMQTLIEEVVSKVACATLFFSRPNHRDNPQRVFTTLAYRLAVVDQEYCRYIAMRLKADPTCLASSLDNQFNTLFVTPFVDNHITGASKRWIMFLDGLDECQNTEDSDNQCRILNLIRDSTFNHDSLPFVWVIASRPEENLKKAWLSIQDLFHGRGSCLREFLIPADSDQATRDVELYLHKEFVRIRTNYAELIPAHSRWPSDGDFAKVAKKSSGLFVFASTVVKYVSHEDPVYRLKFVVSLIEQQERHPAAENEKPFAMIDLLYSSIMSDVPKRLLPAAKTLIGFYLLADKVVVLRGNEQEIGLVEACNILGLRQNEAYAALRKLQSVLICPPPETAQITRIKFFHASFPDFLLDPSRSKEYGIDPDQELTNIWRRYTTIIKESTTIEGINTLWPPYEEPFRLGQSQRRLLQTVQNAWITIVMNNFCSQPVTKTLRVDIPELMEIFHSLGLAFLGGDLFYMEKFLDWVHEGAPAAIRDQIVSGRFPLSELDITRFFKSLHTNPNYRVVIRSTVNTHYSSADKYPHWDRARTALWTPSGIFAPLVMASESKTICVTVLGLEAPEINAVVGPLDDSRRFYILPYHLS